MLFDLTFDPNEVCNLATHAEHQAVLVAMREPSKMLDGRDKSPITFGCGAGTGWCQAE